MSSSTGPTRPEGYDVPGTTGTQDTAGHDTSGHDTTRHGTTGAYDATGAHAGAVSAEGLGADRRSVVAREKEEYGGVKIGSAFFGWLTATGTAVLLTALLAGAGAAVGLATDTVSAQTTDQAADAARTIGIASGVALLVILFIAYFCGGYVAGRMARFDGLKQGLAVWVWAVVIAVVVAVLTTVAGDRFNVLSQLNSFPRIPVDEGDLTTGGIIAAVAVALASLVGAVLGGLAGMRFHRNVDRAGLGR